MKYHYTRSRRHTWAKQCRRTVKDCNSRKARQTCQVVDLRMTCLHLEHHLAMGSKIQASEPRARMVQLRSYLLLESRIAGATLQM